MAPIAEMIWLRDAARFSHACRMRALPQSAKLYHGVGTTSTFEGHGAANELLRVYRQAHHDGTLTMRSKPAFSAHWPAAGGAPLGPLVGARGGWVREPGLGDDRPKIGGGHVQGGGGPAAAGRAPGRLKELLLECARNDIRAVAIAGGGGLGVLDFYEEVDKQIPLKGRRWVVSHVNVISPRDIERIARMGLVLTTHTNAYLYKALETTAGKLKPEQYDDIVPMNALREAGVTVSLATDNVPISLWYPVAQTVARKDFKTRRTFGEKQALSRMNALRAASAAGAYLTFDEAKKGSLEVGKYADLAVLSADPLTVAEDKLADITAQMTMVGGRIVHET